MPLYQYQCRECGHKSEHLILSSNDIPYCPKCLSQELDRQVGRVTLMGLSKGGRGRHEITAWRPDPYNDCKETFRRIEADGKMTPELRRLANEKMAHLQYEKDAGLLKGCDYQKDEKHPLLGECTPMEDDE